MHTHGRDLRFLALFGLYLAAFYLITLTPVIRGSFFPAYLRINARASAAILRTTGQDVVVRDQSIVAQNGLSIEIARGCDAVEPSALFVAAVLASPVAFLRRICAAVAGTALLMLLNLVRIVSLFLVRVYIPKAFEAMHLDVWQAVFIFLAILLWAVWASHVTRKPTGDAHAAVERA